MKTYISGQITGLDINVAKGYFDTIEEKLLSIGYQPINPMKLVEFNPDWAWEDYMIADIRLLFACDAIFLLDNWHLSKGAKVEHAIAQSMGLHIYYPAQHSLF